MGLPANLLNQTISHYPKSSYDVDGREVFGSVANYSARVQEQTKSKFLPNGQVVIIDAVVYLSGSPSISLNDKIIYGGVNYKVHSKSVAIDGQGFSHNTKLELTKWV